MNEEKLRKTIDEYKNDFDERVRKLNEPSGDISPANTEYQNIRRKYSAAVKNKQRSIDLAQARLASLEELDRDYAEKIFAVSQNLTAETAAERSRLLFERNSLKDEIEKAKLALSTAEAGGEEVFKEIINKF